MINKRKSASILIVLALFFSTSTIHALSENDFKKDEAYFHDLCSGPSSRDHETLCSQFTEYINQKISDSQTRLKNIEKQKDDISTSIENQQETIRVYQEEIHALSTTARELKASITAINEDIKQTQINIDVYQKEIDVLNEKVKKNIATSQSQLYVDPLVEFVFASVDFVSLIRRVEGMARIKENNDITVNKLIEAKKVFDLEKEHLKYQRLELEKKNKLIEEQETIKKTYMEKVKKTIASLMEKNKALELQYDELQEKIELDSRLLSRVSSLEETNGFIRPVESGYWVSAGTWTYPWGGHHMGVDLASVTGSIGLNILAPGSGLITAVNGGCPTYGSYPNGSCNGGFGNYITMIFKTNGVVYGAMFAHLKEGSTTVSPGDIVSGGTVLAQMGSSGLSMGPHLHHELYYLGDDSIEAAYERWDRSVTFGTGGAYWGNGWNMRCDTNGRSVPCRENPMTIYQYTLGGEY